MRKINLDGKMNVKGFKMQLNIQIDSCEINNNRHFCGNKDYKDGSKNVKGFNFGIGLEAEEVEINLKAFGKDIKEQVEKAIEEATTTK